MNISLTYQLVDTIGKNYFRRVDMIMYFGYGDLIIM